MPKQSTFLTDRSWLFARFRTAIFFQLFHNSPSLLCVRSARLHSAGLRPGPAARNIGTLVALTIIAVSLLIYTVLLAKILSSILVFWTVFRRQGESYLFEYGGCGERSFSLEPPGSRLCATSTTMREFLTRSGMIAFLLAPWCRVLCLGALIMHPWFGEYFAATGAT